MQQPAQGTRSIRWPFAIWHEISAVNGDNYPNPKQKATESEMDERLDGVVDTDYIDLLLAQQLY
jgi:hypothetical protein